VRDDWTHNPPIPGPMGRTEWMICTQPPRLVVPAAVARMRHRMSGCRSLRMFTFCNGARAQGCRPVVSTAILDRPPMCRITGHYPVAGPVGREPPGTGKGRVSSYLVRCDTDSSEGLDPQLSSLVVSVCCQACEIPGCLGGSEVRWLVSR
jgi:hypothetical protein